MASHSTSLKKKKLYFLLLAFSWSCSPDKPTKNEKKPLAAATAQAPAVAPQAPVETLTSYTWETESCTFSGRYNPRLYSKEQLDNVRRLLYGSAMVFANASVHRPDDIAALSLDTLNAEYARTVARYRNMRVVPQPVWLKLKKQAIQEIEDDYQAHKLYVQAFTNPTVLLAASSADCQKYIQGLATQNDSLTMSNWREFVVEQKRRNGSSEPYTERYNQVGITPDQLLYAKIDLLTYGWWNCVNNSIRRVQPTDEMHEQFNQLFANVTSECDDVD